jgi:hypothetical protein
LSGRGVFIPLFKLGGILAEALLALFACEDLFPGQKELVQISQDHSIMRTISSYHLLSLLQHMRLLLLVAFGAVKPFPALSKVSQLLVKELGFG